MKLNRFVIRKSLIGKDIVIEFTNKKGDNVKYNHDEVYNTHKERFDNCMPAFCRDMKIS